MKDDRQHCMHPMGAASYHLVHTLLSLSNVLQCKVNPGGRSLGGLMKRAAG